MISVEVSEKEGAGGRESYVLYEKGAPDVMVRVVVVEIFVCKRGTKARVRGTAVVQRSEMEEALRMTRVLIVECMMMMAIAKIASRFERSPPGAFLLEGV